MVEDNQLILYDDYNIFAILIRGQPGFFDRYFTGKTEKIIYCLNKIAEKGGTNVYFPQTFTDIDKGIKQIASS